MRLLHPDLAHAGPVLGTRLDPAWSRAGRCRTAAPVAPCRQSKTWRVSVLDALPGQTGRGVRAEFARRGDVKGTEGRWWGGTRRVHAGSNRIRHGSRREQRPPMVVKGILGYMVVVPGYWASPSQRCGRFAPASGVSAAERITFSRRLDGQATQRNIHAAPRRCTP
jgi:hypothetical protein